MAFIKKHILFGDHSEWGWSAERKEVNKNPKFDTNFYTSIMTWRAQWYRFVKTGYGTKQLQTMYSSEPIKNVHFIRQCINNHLCNPAVTNNFGLTNSSLHINKASNISLTFMDGSNWLSYNPRLSRHLGRTGLRHIFLANYSDLSTLSNQDGNILRNY